MAVSLLIMHRWRLNELMARYRIGTNELAEELGYLPGSISKLKSRDDMPRIDGETLANLCDAMNRIIHARGITEVVTPGDLIEYSFDGK